ncbi:RluA family pseudouridine synthase [Agriterribacter sp.]|uniref:RluA family pseudouridine synthase n=1 Tax=Agriterribacter sp. TaxID=2821509 RepID=UPI002B51D96B|nr:RluA family pseudouridine synthase [Agriterribacter sp.]HRP56406.1 RluA family pseudouridine synthase [Agriterribacter sp.]
MQKLKPEIIFEDDAFVAVNKPSGLLSVPDREGTEISLKQLLQQQYGQIWTVHRLDKDTSGVIVFAKDEITHKFLSGLFEGREVEKYYTGLVHGVPSVESGSVDAAITEHPVKRGLMVTNKKGKPALTDFMLAESFGKFSLMRFRIHTGRTHQIRVHMKHIGHPIVCDPLYGNGEPVMLSSIKKKFNLSKKEEEEKPLFNRLALHAERLQFTDAKKQKNTIEAPLPKDMRALLQQLRKWKS